MHLDHVNIRAPSDLQEKVKDFYCGLLGLREGFRPDFGSQGYWLYAGDCALIHLSVDETAVSVNGRGCFGHFAIHATGLARIRQRLEEMGIPYTSDYIAELGVTQLFLEDPAGIGVEVQFLNEHEGVESDARDAR